MATRRDGLETATTPQDTMDRRRLARRLQARFSGWFLLVSRFGLYTMPSRVGRKDKVPLEELAIDQVGAAEAVVVVDGVAATTTIHLHHTTINHIHHKTPSEAMEEQKAGDPGSGLAHWVELLPVMQLIDGATGTIRPTPVGVVVAQMEAVGITVKVARDHPRAHQATRRLGMRAPASVLPPVDRLSSI